MSLRIFMTSLSRVTPVVTSARSFALIGPPLRRRDDFLDDRSDFNVMRRYVINDKVSSLPRASSSNLLRALHLNFLSLRMKIIYLLLVKCPNFKDNVICPRCIRHCLLHEIRRFTASSRKRNSRCGSLVCVTS